MAQATEQQLWEDIFGILPLSREIVPTLPATLARIDTMLELAAVQLFKEREISSPRAERIREALETLHESPRPFGVTETE